MSEYVCDGCTTEGVTPKPKVDRAETSDHFYSRNGHRIDHIVIHYTTSRNIEGTIDWFKHAPEGQRTSAHYIVGRDGILVQIIADNVAAWHAGNKEMNWRSIGIEHVAQPGDTITDEQGKTSLALIAWLVETYNVPKSAIIPHKCVKNTDCCGDLFADFGAGIDASCAEQKAALDKWLKAGGI